ncbi:arginase family protein [Vibrio panuliri]|uniref:Arginase n=1 Tax=Vibrio panuliri TaxID=1381081 RepID=A0A1Q9HQH2_9VIBR|nr:arginase [Vibrio panuliri]KAB1457987.1 arginase [Vibrio panuliri]OLQ89614.1 arginase [Vibrio panuliri]OLQ93108.1 arginase [Vibrio panuliri]
MFGLFRRNKTHSVTGVSSFSMVLMSVSQSIKPMKAVEFEMADQSLQDVFDWLAEQKNYRWLNGGHYMLSEQMIGRYQLNLSRYLGSHTLPVVFSNCTEGVLHALPLINKKGTELGIIHIGNQFEIKPTLEPELGSAYHFALARFNELRLFCMGIDSHRQNEKTLEYAEDLGCDWMTQAECQFSHRFLMKEQLASYLSHCDQVILNIDLASLCPPSLVGTDHYLDVQMVNRIIRQCLVSGKVKMVQLVGWKDKHIFAKSTLAILHELSGMVPTSDKVA